MNKVSKLSCGDESAATADAGAHQRVRQEQFEKFFDQVAITLKVQDPVELILIRDFVWPSWEIARYTQHRVVAFDRKLKGWVEDKLSHERDRDVRHARRAKLLAEYLTQRPPEVSHWSSSRTR